MKILAIETSCDETAVAIIDGEQILSNQIYSQIELHKEYGGVVPEIAARSHVESLPKLLEQSFEEAGITSHQLDAVAATGGPGLIGGVMIGLTYAKSIAAMLDKKFIAINHLEGHALSAFMPESKLKYPFLLLLASGGHCQTVMVKNLGGYKVLGNTLDDAPGESFDKVARMLNLGYPGGPIVEKLASQGNKRAFDFPRPMLKQGGCNFSFSGLKTAVRNIILKQDSIDDTVTANICASFQEAVAEIFLFKVSKALEIFIDIHPEGKDIVIAGGVAANQYIKAKLSRTFKEKGYNIVSPPLALCTDNAVMIAYAALQRLKSGNFSDLSFSPLSRWPLDEIKY